jgi:hypothetical protein
VLGAVGKEAVGFGEVQRLDVGKLNRSLRIMLRSRGQNDCVRVGVAVCWRILMVMVPLLLLLHVLGDGENGVEAGFIKES